MVLPVQASLQHHLDSMHNFNLFSHAAISCCLPYSQSLCEIFAVVRQRILIKAGVFQSKCYAAPHPG